MVKQVLTTADPPLCTRNTLSMCAVGKFGPKAFWPTSDGWLLRLGRKNATFLCHHFPTELTKPNQTDAQIWSPSAQPDLSARTGLGTVSCPLVWLKTLELCLSPFNLIFEASRMGSFDILVEKSWTLFSGVELVSFNFGLPGWVGFLEVSRKKNNSDI